MLFPDRGSTYLDDSHKTVLSKMETFYANSISMNQAFWSEADTDTKFEVGDGNLWNDLYGNLPSHRKRQFNFNRIRPIINMISGHQRRSRKSIIAVPIENADNETSDQFTKVLMWCVNQESILETISESFHGALVTGMNLLQVWLDFRSDPISGNIKVDNCSYNSFIIDPFFKKADLSDCNGIWKRSFLTKRECISLMPDKSEDILGLSSSDSGSGQDGKFQHMPESRGTNNLLTYDEFYYRDYRTQKMLVDTETGESMEWKSEDQERLDLYLARYPQVTIIEQEVPTVRLAIVVQGKVLYDGPNPLGIDKYNFVPVFAYYNPQMSDFQWRIQGVVRGLRDAQYLYNRRRIIELDILESTINTGWVYKENALVNPKDVFLTGQGRGLALKEEAAMTDVQQIQSPVIPPTTIQLSELLAKEMPLISGVNEELLGSALDDKAGVLSMLRQGAGLTTLQGLFDQLDRAQKNLGKIMIDIIQANFTPGKIKKILEGEEPTDQFHNKAFGKYHADVQDGLNTATQRQMQFAQMLQLKELGLPISPEDLLEAATLQNKDRIIKNLQKSEEAAAQQQQQQAEMAMQLQQSQIELAHARSQADIGLYAERTSRVAENEASAVERIHKANSEDQSATLDKIKAVKELEDIDIKHMERYFDMVNALRSQESNIAESKVNEVSQQPIENQPGQQQQVNNNSIASGLSAK